METGFFSSQMENRQKASYNFVFVWMFAYRALEYQGDWFLQIHANWLCLGLFGMYGNKIAPPFSFMREGPLNLMTRKSVDHRRGLGRSWPLEPASEHSSVHA